MRLFPENNLKLIKFKRKNWVDRNVPFLRLKLLRERNLLEIESWYSASRCESCARRSSMMAAEVTARNGEGNYPMGGITGFGKGWMGRSVGRYWQEFHGARPYCEGRSGHHGFQLGRGVSEELIPSILDSDRKHEYSTIHVLRLINTKLIFYQIITFPIQMYVAFR